MGLKGPNGSAAPTVVPLITSCELDMSVAAIYDDHLPILVRQSIHIYPFEMLGQPGVVG